MRFWRLMLPDAMLFAAALAFGLLNVAFLLHVERVSSYTALPMAPRVPSSGRIAGAGDDASVPSDRHRVRPGEPALAPVSPSAPQDLDQRPSWLWGAPKDDAQAVYERWRAWAHSQGQGDSVPQALLMQLKGMGAEAYQQGITAAAFDGAWHVLAAAFGGTGGTADNRDEESMASRALLDCAALGGPHATDCYYFNAVLRARPQSFDNYWRVVARDRQVCGLPGPALESAPRIHAAVGDVGGLAWCRQPVADAVAP